MTEHTRNVTIGNQTYNVRNPFTFQEAAYLLVTQRGGVNRIKDDSASPEQEFLLGLETLSQIQVTLTTSLFLNAETGKTLKEEDLYDPNKVPPEDVNTIFNDILPYLPDVAELLKNHKEFRMSARANPPQDHTQGLVPMLENVPESVKIGDDYHLLRPFSFAMQGIAQRLVSRGRIISRGFGREETNPAILLFDGMLNGMNDSSLFVRALLPKRHDHLIDAGDVADMPGLDVMNAIFMAIRSPSLQTFLLKQSWRLEEDKTPTLPPRRNLN